MDSMICPYCGKTMEQGYIEHPRGLAAWTPEGKKTPFLYPMVERESIMIGDPSQGPVLGSLVTAYLCRTCSKIVIDVPKA